MAIRRTSKYVGVTALTTDRSVRPSGGVAPSMAMTLRHVSDESSPVAVALAPGAARRALEVLSGRAGVTARATGDDEVLVTLDGGAPSTSDLLAVLVRAGVPVRALVPRRQLEDAFLALVGQSP